LEKLLLLLVLVLVDHLELGVYDVRVLLGPFVMGGCGTCPRGCSFGSGTCRCGGVLVEFGADLLELRLKGLVGGLDRVDVAALEGLAHLGDLVLDLLLLGIVELVTEFGELLLALVGERVGVVADLDAFLGLEIVSGVGLGLALHALDLLLAESARSGDGDLLLLARTEVLGGDVQDAVGIDVEGDLDLRRAAGCRRDAIEMEDAKLLVVAGERTFSLEHLDLHTGLVVAVGGEDVALLGRDRGVTGDHRGGDASGSLDREGERGDVEKEDILHVAAEHAALDGRTDGNDFIRIDTLMGLLADHVAGGLDNLGHAGHAADEHELVDVAFLPLGIGQAILDGLDGALEQVVGELLELGTGELLLDVLWSTGVSSDEGKVDLVLLRGGEGDLGLLGLFLDTLDGVRLLGEVDAGLFLKLLDDPIHDAVVPVVATQVGVAIGAADLEDTVSELKGRDVEGTATEIVDGDLLVGFLLETVGQGGGGGLVDDAQDLETSDLAGILGGVALGVVEVRRDRDDRLGDLLTELCLGVTLELRKDHRGDLGRRESLRLAVDLNLDMSIAVRRLDQLVRDAVLLAAALVVLAAHETLYREDGVLRVGDGLALGGLADKTFAAL